MISTAATLVILYNLQFRMCAKAATMRFRTVAGEVRRMAWFAVTGAGWLVLQGVGALRDSVPPSARRVWLSFTA